MAGFLVALVLLRTSCYAEEAHWGIYLTTKDLSSRLFHCTNLDLSWYIQISVLGTQVGLQPHFWPKIGLGPHSLPGDADHGRLARRVSWSQARLVRRRTKTG